MEESRLKRKYDNSLMTEHERRIHDKDIQAYMEGDNQKLFNRGIPGLRAGHEQDLQDKYIGKLFNVGGAGGVQMVGDASPFMKGPMGISQSSNFLQNGGGHRPLPNNMAYPNASQIQIGT